MSAPWVVTCASITSSATPSRTSASPAHESGSTEKPKSAVTSETAPSAPGSTTPGWKISKPIPAIPARKSSETMFGSISVFRNRVRKPGLDGRQLRTAEVQRERALRVLRPVAVQLAQERRQVGAIVSITFIFSACCAVRFDAFVTASTGHVVLR